MYLFKYVYTECECVWLHLLLWVHGQCQCCYSNLSMYMYIKHSETPGFSLSLALPPPATQLYITAPFYLKNISYILSPLNNSTHGTII